MSTHPNAILLLVITPDKTSRKTMRDILAENCTDPDDELSDLKIGGSIYHYKVMEGDYLDGPQISAKEGDLVFWDYITYGYGDTISWKDLLVQQKALEDWAEDVCVKHMCTYEIKITANYW